MTPVILVGHVQLCLVRFYVHMSALIVTKHFSMRHIILWAWQLLVGV